MVRKKILCLSSQKLCRDRHGVTKNRKVNLVPNYHNVPFGLGCFMTPPLLFKSKLYSQNQYRKKKVFFELPILPSIIYVLAGKAKSRIQIQVLLLCMDDRRSSAEFKLCDSVFLFNSAIKLTQRSSNNICCVGLWMQIMWTWSSFIYYFFIGIIQ